MKQLEFEFEDNRAPEAYARGFATGETWDANWYPGGPIVYSSLKSKIPPNESGSRVYHDVWHIGFKRGLEKRRMDCPEFAKWFDAHGNGKYSRYRPIAS